MIRHLVLVLAMAASLPLLTTTRSSAQEPSATEQLKSYVLGRDEVDDRPSKLGIALQDNVRVCRDAGQANSDACKEAALDLTAVTDALNEFPRALAPWLSTHFALFYLVADEVLTGAGKDPKAGAHFQEIVAAFSTKDAALQLQGSWSMEQKRYMRDLSMIALADVARACSSNGQETRSQACLERAGQDLDFVFGNGTAQGAEQSAIDALAPRITQSSLQAIASGLGLVRGPALGVSTYAAQAAQMMQLQSVESNMQSLWKIEDGARAGMRQITDEAASQLGPSRYAQCAVANKPSWCPR